MKVLGGGSINGPERELRNNLGSKELGKPIQIEKSESNDYSFH